MSLAILSGSAVKGFMEDNNGAFKIHTEECFKMLDVNGDGVISRDEFCDGFSKLMALECQLRPKQDIHDLREAIFLRFDEDKNGFIDRREFTGLMREIMSAVARGIGNSLVLIALNTRSCTMKVLEYEYQH